MKTISHILLVLLFLFLIALTKINAQETRTMGPFNELSISGNLDVVLVESSEESVIIHSDNEGDINFSLSGDKLKIKKYDSFFKDDNDPVKITVNYKQLCTVEGHAGSEIQGDAVVNCDRMTIKATSGAEVTLKVEADKIRAKASEGGMLRLEGNTEALKVSAATGGHYYGLDLESKRTYAKANTGGHASVVALDYLEVSAHMGGDIDYKGNPAEVSEKTSFAGNINKL